MNTQKTILKLFYTSSSFLLKLSFFILPIAIFLAISSFLFVDNLLKSYEHYLIKSYIGVEGRYSINTTDKNLIKSIASFSKKNHYIYSTKAIIKTNVIFKSPHKSILKYAKFIVLDKKYLEKKFKTTITPNTLFVNQVFYNSLGSLNLNSFKTLCLKQKCYKIDGFKKVDTGFIESKPIIFITKDFAKQIFKPNFYYIEFLKVDKNKLITYVKKEASKLKTLQYEIKDLINDTKTTKELFNKIKTIQISILTVLAVLSIGIIVLSISVSIEFKKNSLKILHLLGMSIRDLSSTLSIVIFLMMVLILVLSIYLQSVYQKFFLSYASFNKDFFVNLDSLNIIYIFVFSIIISLIVYLATYKIFKGR